jgi:hypothetical protein
MQQRVRKRYRGKIPSSSGQLPVPVALNAELPTLFGCIIHDFSSFVNTYLQNLPRTVGPWQISWDLSYGLHLSKASLCDSLRASLRSVARLHSACGR